jgi:hypothetical protein
VVRNLVNRSNREAEAVDKTEAYLRHAKECRALAKQMESGQQREQLIKMAETWEVLARERNRTLDAAIAGKKALSE